MSDQEAPTAPGCPECQRLRGELDAALKRIAESEAVVHELRLRLDRNASNSSIPPSANPPGAPKPVVKARSRRRRGGQPGHPGSFRRRLPPERVNAVVDYIPEACAACRAPLPRESAPGDPEPTWHQVAEIPDPAVIVTEHRGHARTCPDCGAVTRAAIPAPIVAHVIGPRLAALMSYLVGRHHLSRRGVQEFVADALGIPVSLGTVGTLERQAAAALAAAHDEAGEAVRAAAAKNVDETGWKRAGAKRWLWAAATATVAFFVIHARRNWEGLKALLGEAIAGVICSDRWGTYNRLPPGQRQVLGSSGPRFPQVRRPRRRGGRDRPSRPGGVGEAVRGLVGLPPAGDRSGGAAGGVGPGGRRAPRGSGAGMRLRRYQGGDVLREPAGVVSGAVAVRGDRGGRADE